MISAEENQFTLLSADDPPPIEWVNEHSESPVVMLCEHAGNAIPSSLRQLGLLPAQLDMHIGWDIGAGALARKLAAVLQAPLILQHYSRLLIDCNRPLNTSTSIPQVSDGIEIAANRNITPQEKLARQTEIFNPLNDAINDAFSRYPRRAAFSIHSFTPRMQGQPPRQWHAGFLNRTDRATGVALLESVKQQRPDLTLAINQPYSIDDETDWFIPRYAESRGLVHCLIEIRNDQLLNDDGINNWAQLLASAINSVVGEAS